MESSGGGGSSSEEGGSSSSGSSSEGQESSKETVEITELISKNIIGESKEPDWELIISRVENLYSIWSTISIDLAELNVPEEKINRFNSNLNDVALQAKNENKTESINKLAELYQNILEGKSNKNF